MKNFYKKKKKNEFSLNIFTKLFQDKRVIFLSGALFNSFQLDKLL